MPSLLDTPKTPRSAKDVIGLGKRSVQVMLLVLTITVGLGLFAFARPFISRVPFLGDLVSAGQSQAGQSGMTVDQFGTRAG